MKRTFALIAAGMLALAVFAALYACGSSRFSAKLDQLDRATVGLRTNVMPLASQPGAYLVSPRCIRLNQVMLLEISAAAPGISARKVLNASDWTFYPGEDRLVLKAPIDDRKFLVTIDGDRLVPAVFVHFQKIHPDSVKLAINGRIAVSGQDFQLGDDGRSIIIPGSGDYDLLQFCGEDGGWLTFGNSDPERTTRAMARYFQLPADGNMTAIGQRADLFRPIGPDLKSVWHVNLLPVRDDETGIRLLDAEWGFDPGSQELTLKRAIDPARYQVYAFGDPAP